jgi:hypothetical protein
MPSSRYGFGAEFTASCLRLSARGFCTLSCVGHLTATTVRVGVFVSGVIDALPFLSASPNKPPWEGEPADPDAGGGPKR